MLPHILAKERCVGETENARNLLDGLRSGTEEISDVGKRIFRNPLYRRLARMALADDGEILRSDAELAGEILHRLMLHLRLLQQLQELIEKFARTGIQLLLRHILQQHVAHRQERTLQERLHNLSAIRLPRSALAERRIQA